MNKIIFSFTALHPSFSRIWDGNNSSFNVPNGGNEYWEVS